MKCWKKNCEGEVECVCWCTNPTTYLCGQHILEHLQIASGAEHRLESQTIKPNPETKNVLIDHIHKSLTSLYEFRRKAISDLLMQIKLLNQKIEITLNSFNEIIQKHREMISQISSLENISKLDNNEINQILALPPAESIQKLEEILDIFDESNFFIDYKERVSKSEPIDETNQIVVFRDNTMKIVKVSLNNYSLAEFDIPLDNSKGLHIPMCLLSDNSIFLYGNYPTPSNTAFIIDSNNKPNHLINGPVSVYGAGPIYYKNYVYIFGGYNGSALVANAFKYDLKIKIEQT